MCKLILAVLLFFLPLISTSSHSAGEVGIAIDIGHSPETRGALSARNRPEYEFNRKVALMLLQELKKEPLARPFLINEEGQELTLQSRAEAINESKPGLLISIHHDSVQPEFLSEWTFQGLPAQFCDAWQGYSVFISEKNGKPDSSRYFALALGASLRNSGFIPTTYHAQPVKGERRQPIDAGLGVYRYDDLVILKDVKCPAVLLECGIIKNRGEEKLLCSRAYRLRLVHAVRKAVHVFLHSRE